MNNEYDSDDEIDCCPCEFDSKISATEWILFCIFIFLGTMLGIIFFATGKEKFIITSAPAIIVIVFLSLSFLILIISLFRCLYQKKKEADKMKLQLV